MFGVLRTLLFRVLYWGPLFSETPMWEQVGPGSKTILDDIVDLARSAGLGHWEASFTVWGLVGNGGMDYGDYSRGL